MAQAEVVTVRMSRGNVETPWGFDIVPPIQISNVIANSLADRAGLLSGDTLVELEGYEKPDYQLAKQLLAKAEHKIELIVHRDIGQGTRIWKPSVTDNTEYSRFQHSVHNVSSTENQNQSRIPPPPPPPPTTDGQPVKVSLEHQPQGEVNIPGFNVKAQPYGARQEVKHLQYNSPMPIYSPQSAAEQYLQQTGGLFGTDPNVAKMTEVPAYLRSETLRLIQEDEARKEMSKEGLFPASLQSAQQGSANISNNDTATAIPQCYLCGRNIQGVMCRAFDHYLHPDCFTCATCGTSLKNQGHHFVNGKFYCSVHGRQFETRNTLPKSSANTGLTVRSSSVTANAKRNQENSVRAFYQPEVMARRPLSISPTPWKTQSPISPNNRGIPHSAVQYGQDIKNESYTSPLLTTTIDSDEQPLFDLTKHAPLPEQIHSATSPRRRPSIRKWPPEAPAVRKFWRLDGKPQQSSASEKVVSLTGYIKELDEMSKRHPSPKRHLLCEGVKRTEQSQYSQSVNFSSDGLDTRFGRMVAVKDIESSASFSTTNSEDTNEHSTADLAVNSRTCANRYGNKGPNVMCPPVQPSERFYSRSSTENNMLLSQDVTEPLLTVAPDYHVDGTRNAHWMNKGDILEEADLTAEENCVQQNDKKGYDSYSLYINETSEFLSKNNKNFYGAAEEKCVENDKPEKIYETRLTSLATNSQNGGCLNEGSVDGITMETLTVENQSEEVTEADKEQWMKEEVELALREREQEGKLEAAHLDELYKYGSETEKKEPYQRDTLKLQKSMVLRQRSFEIEQQRMADIQRIEEVREQNIARLATKNAPHNAIWHNEKDMVQEWTKKTNDINSSFVLQDSFTEMVVPGEKMETECDMALSQEFETRSELEEIRRQDENDKKLAIESIRRHQRQLQDQQEQLSQLLDNAIVFLKNLDTEFLKRSPELYSREKIDEAEQNDNVGPNCHQSSPESVHGADVIRYSRTQENAKEINMNHKANCQNFETPSERIIRAIQQLDSISNSFISPSLFSNEAANDTETNNQKTTREVRTVSGVDKPSGYSQFNARNEAQTPSDKIASALQNLEIRQSSLGNNVDSGNGFSRQETRHTMQTGDSVRGRGTLQVQGSRIPYCEQCRGPIRGAYVLANGVAYCPDHFVCANTTCNRKLLEIGFVEEKGQKYCEQCFETLIAPHCAKCNRPIVADCLNALQKQWHPECFVCTHCQRPFGNSAFFLEKGQPYCEDDWNALFTTRCFACNYPIEAGDRWVEALGSAFHSNCFNCTACNVNLEGESFYAKNGAPYCKLHA